jgi:hypothetical protein
VRKITLIHLVECKERHELYLSQKAWDKCECLSCTASRVVIASMVGLRIPWCLITKPSSRESKLLILIEPNKHIPQTWSNKLGRVCDDEAIPPVTEVTSGTSTGMTLKTSHLGLSSLMIIDCILWDQALCSLE